MIKNYYHMFFGKEDSGMVSKNSRKYYKNSKLHRDNGPAIEYEDGTKYWFCNGLMHRDNGPAIEFIG